MANFSKKVEEASEEELYSWINELDPNFTKLASDELTRRKFDKFNKSTTYFSVILGVVALVQVVIAIMQFALSVKYSGDSFWNQMAMMLLFGIAVLVPFLKMNKVLKNVLDNDKK